MKKVYTIPFWDKHQDLISGYSTKHLGNLSFRSGERKVVQTHKEAFAAELGINWKDVLVLPLSHSNRVVSLPKGVTVVKGDNNVYISGGHVFGDQVVPIHYNSEWQVGIDAVVSDIPGMFPLIMSADCAAIGLFDPSTKTYALVHAGLIGAVNQIVKHVVKCMVAEYKADPRVIEAVIFPSIRRCHYDLRLSGAWKRIKVDCVRHYGSSDSVFAHENFDLQCLLQRQLMESGISEAHIYDTKLCTVCNPEMFYSNLAAGDTEAKKNEGRFGSIVGVKYES